MRQLSLSRAKKNVENLKSLWNEKWSMNKDMLNLNQYYILPNSTTGRKPIIPIFSCSFQLINLYKKNIAFFSLFIFYFCPILVFNAIFETCKIHLHFNQFSAIIE